MTRGPADSGPVTYPLDGRNIKSANDFYREIGAAVNGHDGYFGRNLDALADCLRGGFGTPEHGRYEFEWRHSASSRRQLARSATTSRGFFESVRDVFRDAGVPLHLR